MERTTGYCSSLSLLRAVAAELIVKCPQVSSLLVVPVPIAIIVLSGLPCQSLIMGCTQLVPLFRLLVGPTDGSLPVPQQHAHE